MERERQGVDSSGVEDIWPMVLMLDDSCVMWKNLLRSVGCTHLVIHTWVKQCEIGGSAFSLEEQANLLFAARIDWSHLCMYS